MVNVQMCKCENVQMLGKCVEMWKCENVRII